MAGMGIGMRTIPAEGHSAIGDFRRYPGCRLMVGCQACGYAKTYSPERVIDRLRELKSGGYATRLADVARRVARTCPQCSKSKWRAQFAWPDKLSPREERRLRDLYRN